MAQYEHQEYPKARYRNGVYSEVKNEDEEAAADAEGCTDWHTDQQRIADGEYAEPVSEPGAPAKRTRAPK